MNNDSFKLSDIDEFLNPRSSYHGNFSPEKLAFDANLQEFSQHVGFICGLEANGKLTPYEAYSQIKRLWKELQKTKKGLNIDDSGA